MKLLKPDVRFEMTVLHHFFVIAQQLYPNHPLLMSLEERMHRLTDEMLGRIEGTGILFRMGAYQDLLMTTLGLLNKHFSKDLDEISSPLDFLAKLKHFTPMIDENLIQTIQSNLEDDAFVDELQPFSERLGVQLQAAIAVAKQDGTYHPLLHDPLFKLLGLHLGDFISWDELLEISNSDRFQALLTPHHFVDMSFALTSLYYRAEGKKPTLPNNPAENQRLEKDDCASSLSTAKAAARYLDAVTANQPYLTHWHWLAKSWLARSCLLEKAHGEALTLFEQALLFLTAPESLGERHDVLVDRSSLLADSRPERAAAFANEASQIPETIRRSQLTVPSPSTREGAGTKATIKSQMRIDPLARFGIQMLFASMVFRATATGQTHDSNANLPHLEKRGSATQLVVDGKPFLVLGGEVHNSSSSSVEYMKAVRPRLAAMYMNTVLLPVAWETIEPEEGRFDFACVDGLLEGARQNSLRLVNLWFGAWKNTYSSYAPSWVKTNSERFPRVQMSDGRGTERLSPFSAAIRDADTCAFVQLIRYLREADGDKHTVLMVQVQNEVGVIPESRDHSTVANASFAVAVPPALTSYLGGHRTALNPGLRAAWESAGAKSSGRWQEVFGNGSLTDDLFMAWQYAAYIEHVTAAGKAEYPLPMYANAALIPPNYEPGQYNSGGQLPHSMDVWRAAAPSLDFLSPDIYSNEFTLWAGTYTRPGNPLFIPEAQGGVAGAANALYAFGHLSAIGFSPFGVDVVGNAPLDLVGITNPGEHPDSAAIRDLYAELSSLASMILELQQAGSIAASLMEGDAQPAGRLNLGDFTANITRAGGTAGNGSRIGVRFLETAPNEFLVTGSDDAQVTFSTDNPGPPIVGIESIDEEFFENGAWTPRRRLNGDENSRGQALRIYATDLSEGRI